MSDVEGGSVLGNDGWICQAAKIREEHSELRVHVKKNRRVGQAIMKIRNEAPYLGNQRDGSWVGVGTREDQNASAAGLTAYIPLIRRNILNREQPNEMAYIAADQISFGNRQLANWALCTGRCRWGSAGRTELHRRRRAVCVQLLNALHEAVIPKFDLVGSCYRQSQLEACWLCLALFTRREDSRGGCVRIFRYQRAHSQAI